MFAQCVRGDVFGFCDDRPPVADLNHLEHGPGGVMTFLKWPVLNGTQVGRFDQWGFGLEWLAVPLEAGSLVDRRWETAEEDSLAEEEEALFLRDLEEMLALRGLLDDGLIEDPSQRSEELTLARQVGVEHRGGVGGQVGRRASSTGGRVTSIATPNVGLLATADFGQPRALATNRAVRSMESAYFLDWPWSSRPGRNMFYWVFGPPAFVVLAMLSMSVFTGEAKR